MYVCTRARARVCVCVRVCVMVYQVYQAKPRCLATKHSWMAWEQERMSLAGKHAGDNGCHGDNEASTRTGRCPSLPRPWLPCPIVTVPLGHYAP